MKNGEITYKGWRVARKIGSGSFGSVYEIEREDFGYVYKAALKVLSVPKSEQDLKAIKDNIGKSEESLEIYYKSVASELVKEFELMYQLRGTTNIVSYEDHEIRKHENGIGWDIFIRMELLTPLSEYVKKHTMSRKDIINLGIDICKALERCRTLEIIHRDIKPGNIFVSDQGDFKLGDFGIARTLEAHEEVLELSKKGTINYMAPEIYKGMPYNFDVDLYSLGLVMYRLLNHNLLPFIPSKKGITPKDIEMANQSRLTGKAIPYPDEDHTQLAEIILKAVSYRPEDRYKNPKEMREHLEKVLRDETIDEFDEETVLLMPEKKKASKWKKFLIAGIAAAVTLCGGAFYLSNNKSKAENNPVDEVAKENEPAEEDIEKLIEDRNFVRVYKLLQDRTKNGENLDEEIKKFVQVCEEEAESKRALASIKLLSDDIQANEAFYKETVKWFWDHEKEDYARTVLADLRDKGEKGEHLADTISSEVNITNEN